MDLLPINSALDAVGGSLPLPLPPPLPLPLDPPSQILVADDDQTIRRLHVDALSRCGYRVDSAEDGEAAWDALSTSSYDLMVTDNNMPKLSGVELLRKLRASRMSLPVILATGAIPAEEFARSPWLRPAATLLKPYTMVDLVNTVKRVLASIQVVAASQPGVRLPPTRMF